MEFIVHPTSVTETRIHNSSCSGFSRIMFVTLKEKRARIISPGDCCVRWLLIRLMSLPWLSEHVRRIKGAELVTCHMSLATLWQIQQELIHNILNHIYCFLLAHCTSHPQLIVVLFACLDREKQIGIHQIRTKRHWQVKLTSSHQYHDQPPNSASFVASLVLSYCWWRWLGDCRRSDHIHFSHDPSIPPAHPTPRP